MKVQILYRSPNQGNTYSSVEGYSLSEAWKKLDEKFVKIMINNPHIKNYIIDNITIQLSHEKTRD